MSKQRYPQSMPAMTVAKVMFAMFSAYTIASTFVSGVNAFIAVATMKVNIVIFDTEIPTFVLWIGIVIGVLTISLVGYWFKYQDYMMKNEVNVKFDVKYLVSAALTIAVSVMIAAVCVFYGTAYVLEDRVITEAPLATLIAFLFGGVTAWLVDACIFHPLADGTAARAYNKAQELARSMLLSKEAMEAAFQAVASECAAAGITDDAVVSKIAEQVKDPEKQKDLLKVLIEAYSPKQGAVA